MSGYLKNTNDIYSLDVFDNIPETIGLDQVCTNTLDVTLKHYGMKEIDRMISSYIGVHHRLPKNW